MKKNKRLILHIGTIKTGTTSIQDSLGNARSDLFEQNIYYPAIQPYNHIYSFPPIFVENPEKIDWFRRRLVPLEDKNIKIESYRKDWLKEFETCGHSHDFIISAEHLTAPFFVEGAVKRLREFVEPYFEQVTIIAYVRPYDTWIPSEIQQSIKNGFSPQENILEMARNLQNCPPLMSYKESLQKWINVFGLEAVIVRPFDPPVFYNHSLLADFFHACNLPTDDISIPEILSNESIGRNAVVFLQKYNQTYPVFVNNSINAHRGLAREGILINLYKNLSDERFKLEMAYSPEQAQRLNEEIDYVNQFFIDGYQFHYILSSNNETQSPKAEDIPVEFFADLINNYNKHIEFQRKRIENLLEENKNMKERNKNISEQNLFFLKVLNMLKIPFLLRIVNRLPLLKTFLKKITSQLSQHDFRALL